MEKVLYKGLISALEGWKIWHNICKSILKEDMLFVFVPSIRNEYNYCALLYLDDLLRVRNCREAILYTVDSELSENIEKYTSKISKVIICSEEDVANLTQYYSLYNFDSRFVYASFDLPYSKGIENISKISGFDYEDAFALSVYRLKPYSKELDKELQDEK